MNKVFHFEERGATLKGEILGGFVTFVAMCYILPVNASLLSSIGMDSAGVFAITALVAFLTSMIMAIVANYPIALSAGMGLNAFITYTVCLGMGYTWHQGMILLTVMGILFFIFSLTPVRQFILASIPKNIRSMISAALGAFIVFVGLKGTGIIVADGHTFVRLGNFANPGMLLGFISIIICLGLIFVRNKWVSSLAIPLVVFVTAIAGVIISSIMIANGSLVEVDGGYVYQTGTIIDESSVTLPIAPWVSHPQWGMSGVDKVLFYGLLDKSSGYDANAFANDLGTIFSNPTSYVAIFSLTFVNIFDTTATLITVGDKLDFIAEDGTIKNYRKVFLADATGALVCAPLGTSTAAPFVESSIGISVGARTGLASVVTAVLFLLCAFIFPVFSIFTAGSVTACALVAIGIIILLTGIKNIDKNDIIACYTAAIVILVAVLSYSVSNAIGIGLIVYVVSMLFAGRKNEIKVPIYVITILFAIAFAATTILQFI